MSLSDLCGKWWIVIWPGKFTEVTVGVGDELENFLPDYLQLSTKRFGPFFLQIWKGNIRSLNTHPTPEEQE